MTRVVTGFLQQHQVTHMDWPARSPDLAPIENLWGILGRRVHDNHPPAANLAQLFQFLQQKWSAIPQQTLDDTGPVHEKKMCRMPHGKWQFYALLTILKCTD